MFLHPFLFPFPTLRARALRKDQLPYLSRVFPFRTQLYGRLRLAQMLMDRLRLRLVSTSVVLTLSQNRKLPRCVVTSVFSKSALRCPELCCPASQQEVLSVSARSLEEALQAGVS